MNKLDKSKEAAPLYLQIGTVLKDKILKREYEYGEKIPSESELEKQYGVSRITARQAIQELEKEGMVERARGKGTIVVYKKRIEEYLTKIRSFTEEMEERDIQPGTKYAHISIVKASKSLAQLFQTNVDSPVYCLERVRTGGGTPIVFFQSYFAISRNLPLDDQIYYGSLYNILEEKGCKPERIIEKFDCIMPDEETCSHLDIQANQPILRRIRTSFDEKDQVVEYTIGLYRADQYSYHVEIEK